jgi:ADP-heptose:LPS heptosyltransferase
LLSAPEACSSSWSDFLPEPAHRALWTLLPAVEKVIPFPFAGDPNLAEWANLLGLVREPDFQACLNFATGRQVNLMLSMSHIPVRVATEGFSSTALVSTDQGWKPQRLASFLKPLGLTLKADDFRLSLPAEAMEAARQRQPPGEGPLLLLAPDESASDWPEERWQSLPEKIRERLPQLRCEVLTPQAPFAQRAAAVACADVVLSSCAITQLLSAYCGLALVAMGSSTDALPSRDVIRVLPGDRRGLSTEEVMKALGF